MDSVRPEQRNREVIYHDLFKKLDVVIERIHKLAEKKLGPDFDKPRSTVDRSSPIA